MLEARYRRLLTLYPAAHRATHEREMLDLLLSTARPGQTRPSPAEIADLVTGAIRIRLRPVISGDGPSAWPAALALAGFLALLQLLARGVQSLINIPFQASVSDFSLAAWSTQQKLVFTFGTGPYWLAWAGIAVLVWRGRRGTAARAACTVTGVQIVLVLAGKFLRAHDFDWLAASMASSSLPLALLATASLAASPGPLHGARLVGRVRGTILAATAVVLAAGLSSESFVLLFGHGPGPYLGLSPEAFFHALTTWDRLQLLEMSVASVLVLAALARSREGRRAVALLTIAAVPAWGLLIDVAFPTAMGGLASTLLTPSMGGLISGNGGADPSWSITYGLVGFALTMLCVRLVELPTQSRTRRREQTPA